MALLQLLVTDLLVPRNLDSFLHNILLAHKSRAIDYFLMLVCASVRVLV